MCVHNFYGRKEVVKSNHQLFRVEMILPTFTAFALDEFLQKAILFSSTQHPGKYRSQLTLRGY